MATGSSIGFTMTDPTKQSWYAQFNLKANLGERNDLAERMPEKIIELSVVLNEQIKSNVTIPATDRSKRI